MDWNSAILAFLGGGLAGSIIAVFANRRNKAADTYQKLSNVVASLTDDLTKEQNARRKDRDYFGNELCKLREEYKLKLLALEERVNELEVERNSLLLENHKLKQQMGN